MKWEIRIQPGGAGPSRVEQFETKNQALAAIARLGKLGFIQRIGPRVWSVRPKLK